ncbi:MAG: response regulator [Actinomycetota bacterium]|nr:response regulator [Actinomycetota bacterium]
MQGQPTVLLAEDEALIRLDLKEMLEEEGYEVVGEAGDGDSAVRLARERRPDLVILDIKMPGLDGLTAAQRISEEGLAPVVVLTAFSQRELVERAARAGAMAYLVKPFQKADVLPAIEVAVARYGQIQELEDEVADREERLETRTLVDRAKGVLMDTYRMKEADAFRFLQKTAMDRRLKLAEVARLVNEGELQAVAPEGQKKI